MKKNIIFLLIVFIFAGFPAIGDAGGLTDAEAEGILLMREEEKLARDVYLALYEKWGIPIFENIAESEQKHMDEMGILIRTYGLIDPVETDVRGIFKNIELQNLYNELVAQGSTDLLSALRTGTLIEDLDIADLGRLLLETNKADIRIVYHNLEKGSRNHLRSFYEELVRRGGDYSPEFITLEYYNRIINSTKETGAEISDPNYAF